MCKIYNHTDMAISNAFHNIIALADIISQLYIDGASNNPIMNTNENVKPCIILHF